MSEMTAGSFSGKNTTECVLVLEIDDKAPRISLEGLGSGPRVNGSGQRAYSLDIAGGPL